MPYWDKLRPQPPVWALEAGLPAPREDENFVRYVTRLGLDSSYFFEDLTAQTAERTVCAVTFLTFDRSYSLSMRKQ